MKGLVLAGGHAKRLHPLTKVTNKHLLPVYDKPMVFYPLETLHRAGIEEVMITTNPHHAGHFIDLLRDGRDHHMFLSYAVQDGAGGIAEAIGLAEDFAGGEPLMVILGDNITNADLQGAAQQFDAERDGAVVFATPVQSDVASEYGIIEVSGAGAVIGIEEKPKKPKSNLAQSGIYMYDATVFDRVKQQKPSQRGELEVTDLNVSYLEESALRCEELDGYWIDAGTSPEELFVAGRKVRTLIEEGYW